MYLCFIPSEVLHGVVLVDDDNNSITRSKVRSVLG